MMLNKFFKRIRGMRPLFWATGLIAAVSLAATWAYGQPNRQRVEVGRPLMSVDAGAVTSEVGSDFAVSAGVAPMTAETYDTPARWRYIANFITNPGLVAHSQIYFVYNIEELSSTNLNRIFTSVVNGESGSAAFMTLIADDSGQEQEYFGTPFLLSGSNAALQSHDSWSIGERVGSSAVPSGFINAMVSADQFQRENYAYQQLLEAGRKSINLATPKSSQDLPTDTPLFIATTKPVSGVDGAYKVLSYDPVERILDETFAVRTEDIRTMDHAPNTDNMEWAPQLD